MRALLTLGAFAAIYLIWGSTYLAIRVAIETIPPLLMTAGRAVIAGAILLAATWVRRGALPGRREMAETGFVGVLLVVGGNGGVALAERTVASSVAALAVATVPLWVTLVEALAGRRPEAERLGGLALALAGVIVLSWPAEGDSIDPFGLALLMGAALSWSLGSTLSRHAGRRVSLMSLTGIQLLTGGMVLAAISVISGEASTFDPGSLSRSSALAVVYLIVFGSLVAFSAYTYLLGVTLPSRVATYAFVNPLVAVALGTLVGGEVITPRIATAATLILLGVLAATIAPLATIRRLVIPRAGVHLRAPGRPT